MYGYDVSMPNPQRVPDATQMRRYLEQGLSQQQIADQWEKDSGHRVTRAAIGMAMGRYGLRGANARDRYDELIPWKVEPEHREDKNLRLLRLESRRRLGKPLSDEELTWLENWKDELREHNAVVHYDAETDQGWWLVQRTKADGPGALIRRPA